MTDEAVAPPSAPAAVLRSINLPTLVVLALLGGGSGLMGVNIGSDQGADMERLSAEMVVVNGTLAGMAADIREIKGDVKPVSVSLGKVQTRLTDVERRLGALERGK